jgi:microcompartment protein CcmL/EutN
MPQAVGVIQTVGFPPVLAAADAMVKESAVTLVYYGLAERAEFLVIIRGVLAEVKAAEEAAGGIVASHYIIPNPPDNVEQVMDIRYTSKVDDFRFY